MIKRFYFIAVFLLLLSASYSQFDTAFAKTNIRRCADSLALGFKIKDWELFARYSYPALIGSMGGKKDFMNYMAIMYSQIPDNDWKLYETGKILQVIKTAGDLQTVIELKSVVEWQGTRFTTITPFIGESWDGGLFWTFFDSEGDRAAALLMKPDLSDQLIIPKKMETNESISSPPKIKNNP